MTDEHTGNKYHRKVHSVGNAMPVAIHIDVYCVLEAFSVTCPARQHAIKKLLCSGIRGKNDTRQDLVEARDAISRAIELEDQRIELPCGTAVCGPSDTAPVGVTQYDIERVPIPSMMLRDGKIVDGKVVFDEPVPSETHVICPSCYAECADVARIVTGQYICPCGSSFSLSDKELKLIRNDE
jgi:hypothetical protein